jgi:hypothetical protein
MRHILIGLALLLFSATTTLAEWNPGGTGATCTPYYTANWATCTKITPTISTSGTIAIPAGTGMAPFSADTPNRRYVLQGNRTASGVGIMINASDVIIDLNGFTLTYNESTPGEGVAPGSRNRVRIAVINGTIKQGAARSPSPDTYGTQMNPVSQWWRGGAQFGSIDHLHLANLHLEWSGYDTSGVGGPSENLKIEECTLNDLYTVGPIGNRQHIIKAIDRSGTSSSTIVRYNTILNGRHQGINIGRATGAQVYENKIFVNSLDTNGSGIGMGHNTNGGNNNKVWNNTIVGRGAHIIGIATMSLEGRNNEVWNNSIDLQITSVGSEYSAIMYAAGWRTTWSGGGNRFYSNKILIRTDSAYQGTYAETGAPVTLVSRGKGLFIGHQGNTSRTTAENNLITFTGDGPAIGVSPGWDGTPANNGFFLIGNTIQTHYIHIAPSDGYYGPGHYPLFLKNTLTKTGDFEDYKTIASFRVSSGVDIIGAGNFNQYARLVDNVYENGASVSSYSLAPGDSASVSVYFGSYTDGDILYDYRLYDSGSSLLTENFDPPEALSSYYLHPETCSDWSALCATQAGCESTWNGYTWTDNFCTPPALTEPTCALNPNFCATDDEGLECEEAGWHWDTSNSACIVEATANCNIGDLNLCDTPEKCATLTPAHYFYNGVCSALPEQTQCRNNYALCADETECLANYPTYNWCENISACQPGPCPVPGAGATYSTTKRALYSPTNSAVYTP